MKLPLKVLIHSIFWLVYLMFAFVFSISPNPDNWPLLSNIAPHFIVNFLWAAVIFYLFYFYFIRFFEWRQFVKYLLFSFVLSIAVTFLFLPVHRIFFPSFMISDYRIFGPPIAGSFIIAQCGCLVRGFENWFGDIQQKTELENRNLKNELELLKSQVNPHFLFNTLNNIDSLIQKSPEDASKALISLSDMLRYMIYDTKTDMVPLNQEIAYIRHYIRLQQIRFRQTDYVTCSLVDNCSACIAPLLLLPFIENAFKYAYNTGQAPVISINLLCSDNMLHFTTKNYFNKDQKTIERTGGVGLENVKRRLALIYPGKHNLKIWQENNTFMVDLKIELK
jgi:two-component system, LytTR family, sensor kinase